MDDFSSIIGFIPDEYHSTILAALTVAGLALPLLQWIANKTANTWDNALVARIEWVLARVPRIGFGNTQRAQQAVQRTSIKPPPIPPEALALLMSIATPLALTFALQACAGTEKAVHDAQDHVAQMRERSAAAAADLREDLDAAASSIIIARSAVEIACGFYRIEQCTAAESTIAVLEAAHKAASTAVDSMERSGLVLESVAAQAGHVVEQASALSATVRALEEAVHAAAQGMAQGEDRPVAPSDSGPAGAPSPEGAAPAAAAP